MKLYDLVVIGGGPAGLAAAIKASKDGVEDILIIERDKELGGILTQCIHNGFGVHRFKEELTGPEYAQRFINEIMELAIPYRCNTMVVDIHSDKTIEMVSPDKGYEIIKAKSIVLAMGCRERTAGAINIPGTRPSGVFTAGAAQRYINMEGYMVGKKVVILGSGDIGLIMARRMTLEGAEVLAVVELMPYSNGLTRNIVQCLDDYDIPLYLSHTVTHIHGKNRVEGIEISQVDENRQIVEGTVKHFECDTLLLSVGLIPENELTEKLGAEIDRKTKGPVVDEAMSTSVPGVFACGNVVHVHDLVDFVSAEAERAGASAASYIHELNNNEQRVNVAHTKAGNGVLYVVPQSIKVEHKDKMLEVFFRVNQVYKNAKVNFGMNGEVFKTVNKRHMAPGEMNCIRLEISEEMLEHMEELSVEVSA